MEFGDGQKIKFLGDEFDSSSSSSSSSTVLNLCRICHEEEDASSFTMEAPCSCSGTLKFAHRRCIQRWCYEKGSDVCEICLQKFEPAYTHPSSSKPHSACTVINIRESLAKQSYDREIPAMPILTASSGPERDYIEPSATSSSECVSWCRLLIYMVAIILLLRNLMVVLSSDADNYAFSLATVLVLRAMGILLPFCLIMRLIAVIHNSQKLHLRLRDSEVLRVHGVEVDLERQ